MRRALLREPTRARHGSRRWPYKRKNDLKRERVEQKLRRAGLRYLIEVLGLGVFALLGAALFLGSPLLHTRPIALTWDELAHAKYAQDNGTEVLQLHRTTVKLNKRPVALRGFVTLLGEGDSSNHFVLSSKPPSCPRCLPPGSQQVEVFSSTPIRYSAEPTSVSGRLSSASGSSAKPSYQLLDASLVQQ
jgi:hypothetical protein